MQSNAVRASATFARTDATDAPMWQQPQQSSVWQQSPSWQSPAWQQPEWSAPRSARRYNGALDAMIARHAAANGLPAALVHRVVIRESRYNPGARNGSNLGLMQIKYATARGIGYTGAPAGLLNAETNLTYAVRYLAGAYRAAGGNAGRAVAYYASGYHGRGARQAPPQQAVAWSQPSWEMQSAPVLMRDADMVASEPRMRRRVRL